MAPIRRTLAALLVTALVAPSAALAQGPEPDAKGNGGYAVSLDRIRRELRTALRTTESRNGLRIQYYVEVYGRAPKLELFTKADNVAAAPVMYGGMTHQEFLNVVTPQEFRAPAADIPGAIAALIKWYAGKRKPGGDK